MAQQTRQEDSTQKERNGKVAHLIFPLLFGLLKLLSSSRTSFGDFEKIHVTLAFFVSCFLSYEREGKKGKRQRERWHNQIQEKKRE